MKKPIVAIIQLPNTDSGLRRYACADQSGQVLAEYKVHDSGYGAHLALKRAMERFRITSAAWAAQVARKLRAETA